MDINQYYLEGLVIFLNQKGFDLDKYSNTYRYQLHSNQHGGTFIINFNNRTITIKLSLIHGGCGLKTYVKIDDSLVKNCKAKLVSMLDEYIPKTLSEYSDAPKNDIDKYKEDIAKHQRLFAEKTI